MLETYRKLKSVPIILNVKFNFWLGYKDSNLDLVIQSHSCYRYTISQ